VPLPEFDVNLFWHAKFHKEPGSQWLRNVIADLSVAQGVGTAAAQPGFRGDTNISAINTPKVS
jgi:hypothetical protein